MDDEVRAGHRRLGVADRALRDDRGVVRPAVVEPGRRAEGRLGRGQRGQPLIVDGHCLEPVGERVRALGHHDREGLADEADELARQHRLAPRPALLAAAVRGRHVRRDPVEIRRAPGGHHSGCLARTVEPDLDDARVSFGAPHDAEMQQAGAREVVDESSAAQE